MKYSKYLAALLLGSVVSFALGWQAKSLFMPALNDAAVLAQVSNISLLEKSAVDDSGPAKADSVQEETDAMEAIQSPVSQSDGSSEFEQALSELAQLSERLENGELIEDLDAQISRFMDIVIQLGENRYGRTQEKFARVATQILSSKKLFAAFIDYYPKLPNASDQHEFAIVFLNPRGVDSPFRENHILDKIKSNDQASTWLRTLSNWGVQEASTVDYLLDQIPYLNDPDDLASAIIASNNVVRPKGASDSEFMPAREDAASIYEPYFDAEEDAVRAAAIGTLKTFPRDDTEELVTQAMADQSVAVKQQAVSVIRARKLKSKVIQDSLLGLIRNENEMLQVRSFAVAALRETAPEGSISLEIIEIARDLRQQQMIEMGSQQ